jgi:hypothetical protein
MLDALRALDRRYLEPSREEVLQVASTGSTAASPASQTSGASSSTAVRADVVSAGLEPGEEDGEFIGLVVMFLLGLGAVVDTLGNVNVQREGPPAGAEAPK